jgi:hypothetical protein
MNVQSIGFEISDKVRIPVKVVFKDGAGIEQERGFYLHAYRVDTEEFKTRLKEAGNKYQQFLDTVVFDWELMRGGHWTPPPYSSEGFKELCKVPGLAAVMFNLYSAECGAQEKN